QFSVVNGSFNVVSKTSFVFGGDYSKAVVDTIQLQDNTALVEFTMPKTSSADKAELYGTVALKSSSLINDWGENNSIPAFPLSYKADERVIMSNNGALSQDDMKQLLNAIKKSALENAVWDLSTLGNITGVELDNEKTLSYYFDEINRDFVYFDNLYVNIKDSVHSSRITGKKARVIDARNKLDIFLSDIETLKAAIMSVDSALAVIAQYETADLDMLSPEELEKLTNEYNIARDKVRSVYNNRIKGSSFRELLIGLADNYMAENGALQSFDYLIDCSYNWQPQTVSEKNKFRYYVNGILAKGYIIALLSTGINYDYGAGSGEISQLRDSVSTISDFFDSSIVSERNDGRVFCNTLGRSFSLNAYDDGTGINSLTSAQISQLVNMLPRATSLRDELLSVGFDVSDVRYLICSDGGKSNSHSSSSAIEGNLAVKTYTRTSRAMVYDLIGSVIIEDFVYENIALCLSSEGKELPTLSMIAVKNIDLYALR
ncbi:MAG: hypothetical protein IKT78_04895, partial [Ruminiclostridium sp.]|nr:hypothetical protein [Ruminiclostridium sp.]